MSEFIRVKHDVFGEYTISDAAFDPEVHTKVDKPAVDQNGDTLPAKPKTSVAKKAAEKNGGEPAEKSKEDS